MDHPTQKQLLAFNTGDLDESEVESITTHLAECEVCAQTMCEFPKGIAEQSLKASVQRGDRRRNTVHELREKIISDILTSIRRESVRYEFLECRKLGAMGVILKAKLVGSDKYVALKVFDELYLTLAQDSHHHVSVSRRRFHREFDIGQRLHHNHIVSVWDYVSYGGRDVIELSWIDGVSIREFIEQGGTIGEGMAISWMIGIALAMEYYSESGIVHRDIKPENCLVDLKNPNRGIYLIDFGLAKDRSGDAQLAQLTIAKGFVGTPQFAAPEQHANPTRVDIRADIYSLGMTMIWAMSSQDVRTGSIPGTIPKSTASRLSQAMLRLLRRMIADCPDDRFQAPKEVLLILQRLQKARAAASKRSRLAIYVHACCLITLPLVLLGVWATVLSVSTSTASRKAPMEKETSKDRKKFDEKNAMLNIIELTSNESKRSYILSSASIDDFTIDGDFSIHDPAAVLDLLFRESDEKGSVGLRIHSSNSHWNDLYLRIREESSERSILKRKSFDLGTEWHSFRVIARQNECDCFLDGERIFYWDELPRRAGRLRFTFLGGTLFLRNLRITLPDGRVERWVGPTNR
jgi:serine/threonine protein kinase